VQSWLALWMLPVIFLTGIAFSGMGLVMTALSPSYDFFMYYFTLVITPMMLACGVFFPLDQLPPVLQTVAQALPLTHAVGIARPLLNGALPEGFITHLLPHRAHSDAPPAAQIGPACSGSKLFTSFS
jgi:lipooligosaccharide transport system permease protein